MSIKTTKKQNDFDFGGYVTVYDVQCADGVTLQHGIFSEQDGAQVPLVWQHGHNNISNVIGNIVLEHLDDGVYGYGYLNNTDNGTHARKMIQHGDIEGLSIYATDIDVDRSGICHSASIKEVSLVLNGANPCAKIDTIAHSDDYFDAVLYHGIETEFELAHADEEDDEEYDEEQTIGDILETLNEEQAMAVNELISTVMDSVIEEQEQIEHSEVKMDSTMLGANVIRSKEGQLETVKKEIMHSMRNDGEFSLRAACLSHSVDLGELLPTPQRLKPQSLFNDGIDEMFKSTHWDAASHILNAVGKVPSLNVTARQILEVDDGRGFTPGDVKTGGDISTLSKTVTPTTVYVTLPVDRDTIVDSTDFDLVAYIWDLMNRQLRERIARGIMISQADYGGTLPSYTTINETKLVPIVDISTTTNDNYVDASASLNISLNGVFGGGDTSATPTAENKSIIYKLSMLGSRAEGTQKDLYIGHQAYHALLNMRDNIGNYMFRNKSEVAARLNVNNIYPINYYSDFRVAPTGTVNNYFMFINLNQDYTVGGLSGAGKMFSAEDFDLQYNKYRYLLECRLCGMATTRHGAYGGVIEIAI